VISSIISCLIYLEVIELNFCNLNINLKKNISEREKEEADLSVSLISEMEI
jgi:hypothetical protein